MTPAQIKEIEAAKKRMAEQKAKGGVMLKLMLLLAVAPAYAASYTDLAGQLVAQGQPKVVAVANLAYADERESRDGLIVSERLTTALAGAKVTVIERSKLEQVLAELKLQRSGAVAQDKVQDIGKLLGADAMVVGTLTELPERKIELNLRLVSVETGQIVAVTSGTVRRDWVTQKPLVADMVPVIVERPVLRRNVGPNKAIRLGSGCGCDIYYEGDGSFMRWLQSKPHGEGGQGAYIKREDNQFCNFVAYISQLVEYQHPELKEAWANYRRDNGI